MKIIELLNEEHKLPPVVYFIAGMQDGRFRMFVRNDVEWIERREELFKDRGFSNIVIVEIKMDEQWKDSREKLMSAIVDLYKERKKTGEPVSQACMRNLVPKTISGLYNEVLYSVIKPLKKAGYELHDSYIGSELRHVITHGIWNTMSKGIFEEIIRLRELKKLG